MNLKEQGGGTPLRGCSAALHFSQSASFFPLSDDLLGGLQARLKIHVKHAGIACIQPVERQPEMLAQFDSNFNVQPIRAAAILAEGALFAADHPADMRCRELAFLEFLRLDPEREAATNGRVGVHPIVKCEIFRWVYASGMKT